MAETIGLFERPVPGMPDSAIDQFDMQVDGDLADVVQERRVGHRRRPGFGLHRLFFRGRADRQETRLPQFQGADDGFQPVIQHPTRIGMVMILGSGKHLYQFGVAFQGILVQERELCAGERCMLSYRLQQLPAAGRSQQ